MTHEIETFNFLLLSDLEMKTTRMRGTENDKNYRFQRVLKLNSIKSLNLLTLPEFFFIELMKKIRVYLWQSLNFKLKLAKRLQDHT